MSKTSDAPKNIHHGRNVKRFREMLGLKQEALAIQLGDDWSQKRISLLESKETIEEDVLAQIAAILNVPAEAIKNFDEEKAIYNIQNNYEGSHNQGPLNNYGTINFNPIDKLLELFEENKKLYERLLASEQEKVEVLKNKN